jgi:sugar/nucleoside kinase (ribokinase family)
VSDTQVAVVGLGNAIVDVLVETDDAFLEQHDLPKGAMTLIDADRALELYRLIEGGVECSGGSAANTMVGIASLGGSAGYIGKVRNDPIGGVFGREIRKAGVGFNTAAAKHGPPTGRCLIFVTPDAQRTMQTFLGASATLAPEDLDAETIASAGITFLEGYLWDPPPAKEAFLEAARIAHEAGRKVALTLSDPFCVDRHRDSFRDLVENHVDVLFANEEEACALYEAEDRGDVFEHLKGKCELAAVTRGSQGSVVLAGAEVIRVAAEPVERVVDTTGAGDLFAAGFLFGLSDGRDPETCARLGSIAAAEIISHVGARPEISLAELAASKL